MTKTNAKENGKVTFSSQSQTQPFHLLLLWQPSLPLWLPTKARGQRYISENIVESQFICTFQIIGKIIDMRHLEIFAIGIVVPGKTSKIIDIQENDLSLTPSNSCSLPPLPSSPNCKDPAFTGTVLPKPRRIVLMLLFGFEVFVQYVSNKTRQNFGQNPQN